MAENEEQCLFTKESLCKSLPFRYTNRPSASFEHQYMQAPKAFSSITSNSAGSLQITKLWWVIPLVKNSCWELTVQEEPGKCKGLSWQEWRGDLVYYNQNQSCGNESRGYPDLSDQPASKLRLFYSTMTPTAEYTPRRGEKAQCFQIWQLFWKEILKPWIEKQRH